MPSAFTVDTRGRPGKSGPQDDVYRVESKPGRFWYPRPCGHVSRTQDNLDAPCPHCAANAEGEACERLLDVEFEGIDYALAIARARRDARMSRPQQRPAA